MYETSLFLGSGASAAFGKPTTIEFRNRLRNETPFADDTIERLYHHLISYPGFSDIEYVLECLKNLHEFRNTQGSSFIFDTNNDVRFIAAGRDAQMKILAANSDRFYDYLVDKLFEFYTFTLEELDAVQKIYSEILDPLLHKGSSIDISTTNYDLAIEKFGISRQISVVDGFEFDPSKGLSLWKPEVFNHFSNSNLPQINLYKVHGSLNWVNHVQYDFAKLGDNQTRMRSGFMKSNLLIHPTLSPKDEEQNEPYKTLINKFNASMDNSKSCIVIGFSFRDHVLNGIFKKFVESGKKLVVISPTCREDIERLKLGQVLQLKLIEKPLEDSTVDEILSDLSEIGII